jgi:hypothetical protein
MKNFAVIFSNNKETQMKKTLFILLFATSSVAFAHNCPNVMKEIDAKMGSAKGVSPENLAQVKKLRAEGEQLHKEGKHDESLKALEKAKGLLGA